MSNSPQQTPPPATLSPNEQFLFAFLRDQLDRYHSDMKTQLEDLKRMITESDKEYIRRQELRSELQIRDQRLDTLEKNQANAPKIPTWASMALGLCASGAITLLSYLLMHK